MCCKIYRGTDQCYCSLYSATSIFYLCGVDISEAGKVAFLQSDGMKTLFVMAQDSGECKLIK